MSEFEKKSERIEIRVSHSKKQAFNEACESSGDTPSSALRRFIDSYIRRADGDAFKDGLRAMGRMARRRWIPLSAATAALLVGGFFTGQALKPTPQDGPIVTASTDDFPPIDYALFAAYDKNANGVLDLGEVAENDEHLHRVLNLDGEAGISPAEFYEKAKMQWVFVETGSLKTDRDENGPTAIYKPLENEPQYLVEFDLLDTHTPTINVIDTSKPQVIKLRSTNPDEIKKEIEAFKRASRPIEQLDRGVSWERGKRSPALSFSNHDFRERRSEPS